MRLQIISALTLALVGAALCQAQDFPYLAKSSSATKLSLDGRSVWIVGEVHPRSTDKSAAAEQARALRAEIMRDISARRFVLVLEELNRDSTHEADFAARFRSEHKELKGVIRGLEGPQIKAFAALGVVHLYSKYILNLREFLEAGDLSKADYLKVEAVLERTNTLVTASLLPEFLSGSRLSPLWAHWKALSASDTFKNQASFLTFYEAIQDQRKSWVTELSKKLNLEDPSYYQHIETLAALTKELARKMLEDETVPVADRRTYPSDAFNLKQVTPAKIVEFLQATSPLREKVMLENLRQLRKDFPQDDIVLIMGEDHAVKFVKELGSK